MCVFVPRNTHAYTVRSISGGDMKTFLLLFGVGFRVCLCVRCVSVFLCSSDSGVLVEFSSFLIVHVLHITGHPGQQLRGVYFDVLTPGTHFLPTDAHTQKHTDTNTDTDTHTLRHTSRVSLVEGRNMEVF